MYINEIPEKDRRFCPFCGKEKKTPEDNYCWNCRGYLKKLKKAEDDMFSMCCRTSKIGDEFCGVCGKDLPKVEKLT